MTLKEQSNRKKVQGLNILGHLLVSTHVPQKRAEGHMLTPGLSSFSLFLSSADDSVGNRGLRVGGVGRARLSYNRLDPPVVLSVTLEVHLNKETDTTQ